MAESIPEPAWKFFTTEQLASIESARAIHGIIEQKPGFNYGSICRACTKPNTITVTFCTGCGFPSTAADIDQLPDNIFLELVRGKDIGAVVRYRSADYIVFDDKFPVSDNHIDIIPTTVYIDISILTREHIPIIKQLYILGRQELIENRSLSWLQLAINNNTNNSTDRDSIIDSFITAGFNYPVSVKHLHLHMALPPFKHEKIVQYPRWHSYNKVLTDLELYGQVRLYTEYPDELGTLEQQRALDNHQRVVKLMEQQIINSNTITNGTTATNTTAAL